MFLRFSKIFFKDPSKEKSNLVQKTNHNLFFSKEINSKIDTISAEDDPKYFL